MIKNWALAATIAFFGCVAGAQPSYQKLAAALYPSNLDDQAFTAKFFNIVEAHKTSDPFLGGRGPSIAGYRLDKIKFSFMINVSSATLDLVFFNWSLPIFPGLELNNDLSDLYGSNVYVMKNLRREAVASQGIDGRQLTNFSYMFGASYMEDQIKQGAPAGYKVPDEFLDWKPNPNYLDRSTPLRQTLDSHNLVMLSPSKDVFFDGFGMDVKIRPFMEAQFKQKGGFQNMIMGMMVHEMFHVKEGEDQVNGLATGRKLACDRQALALQLQNDLKLQSLLNIYEKIIFLLGADLKFPNTASAEAEKLADLSVIIRELKSKYPEAWRFIWDYEYTEGFAEYVSAFSMVQVGVTTLGQKIDLEENDELNNFTYRTGTIGGLYLVNRLRVSPFANNEDHSASVWELVLLYSQTLQSSAASDDLILRYRNISRVNTANEIKRIVEYLQTTGGSPK